MTLAQLRYAVAVAEHGSFREAARACHISQPALSMQVHKLESTLEATLFDRSRQPIVTTEVGERLLGQARSVLTEADRMADALEQDTGEPSGRYRLGIIPTLASTLLPLVLPRFARQYPRVDLVIEELQTEVLLDRLKADRIDGGLAATPLDERGVIEEPLYREPLHVYLPAGHPLAQRKRLRQSELYDESVWLLEEGHCFRHQVLHLCKVHRPLTAPGGGQVRFESGSFETLLRLVDAGFGITIVPELAVSALPAPKRRARVRPFAAPVPTREISFLSSRRQLRHSIAEALVQTLRTALPEQGSSRAQSEVLAPR